MFSWGYVLSFIGTVFAGAFVSTFLINVINSRYPRLSFLRFPLMFAVTILLQLYVFNPGVERQATPTVVEPGASYTLPAAPDLTVPVVRELFFDMGERKTDLQKLTVVKTPTRTITFSDWGASISAITYHQYGDLTRALSLSETSKDEAPFLVSLSGHAPFYYIGGDVVAENGTQIVTYHATTHDWRITKTFTIPDEGYSVTCAVTCEPRTDAARASASRLHVELGGQRDASTKSNAYKAVVGSRDKTSLYQLSSDDALAQGWVRPDVFGVENASTETIAYATEKPWVQRGFFKTTPSGDLVAVLEGAPITSTVTESVTVYVGPKAYAPLAALGERFGKLVYDGYLRFVAMPLIRLVGFLETYTGNYGWALVLTMVLVKVLFFPFGLMTRRSREDMVKYSPHLAYLKKRYPNEADYERELMLFYKERNVSFTGAFVGFIANILFFLVFISLSGFASSAVELYKVPFLGWVPDLSAADPFYILPVLGMFGMTLMMNTMGDEQKKQMGMMKYLPFIMGLLFLRSAAIYHLVFVVNALLIAAETTTTKLFSRGGE